METNQTSWCHMSKDLNLRCANDSFHFFLGIKVDGIKCNGILIEKITWLRLMNSDGVPILKDFNATKFDFLLLVRTNMEVKRNHSLEVWVDVDIYLIQFYWKILRLDWRTLVCLSGGGESFQTIKTWLIGKGVIDVLKQWNQTRVSLVIRFLRNYPSFWYLVKNFKKFKKTFSTLVIKKSFFWYDVDLISEDF